MVCNGSTGCRRSSGTRSISWRRCYWLWPCLASLVSRSLALDALLLAFCCGLASVPANPVVGYFLRLARPFSFAYVACGVHWTGLVIMTPHRLAVFFFWQTSPRLSAPIAARRCSRECLCSVIHATCCPCVLPALRPRFVCRLVWIALVLMATFVSFGLFFFACPVLCFAGCCCTPFRSSQRPTACRSSSPPPTPVKNTKATLQTSARFLCPHFLVRVAVWMVRCHCASLPPKRCVGHHRS
jgi:hypothetical protein